MLYVLQIFLICHKMQSFAYITYLGVVFLTFIPLLSYSLPQLEEQRFESLFVSKVTFGVLLLQRDATSKNASVWLPNFKYLDNALPELEKFNVSLYMTYCEENSSTNLCQRASTKPSIALFKNKTHIDDVNLEAIHSKEHVKSIFLHFLNNSLVKHIEDAEDWKMLIEDNVERKPIVFLHCPTSLEKLLTFFISSALQFQEHIIFAYSREEEFPSEVLNVNSLPDIDSVWLVDCNPELWSGNDCYIRKYTQLLTAANLIKTFGAMTDSLITELSASSPAETYRSLVNSAFNNNSDVFLFAAGSQKQTKMKKLAYSSCFAVLGHARCIVITGDLSSSKWFQHRVEDSRIFFSILTHQTHEKNREIFLQSETESEISSYYKAYSVLRNLVQRKLLNVKDQLLEDGENDEEEEEKTLFDEQDDPVAYSVHFHKPLHDLYLYDYKTIPRLTDVTYDETIKSGKYSVILFTLEFNAKSLAVLEHFRSIHQEFKTNRGSSPLFRVECFDWPDVCAKANVITYPRMFIHAPLSRTNNSSEYTGMWSREGMRHTILMNSLPVPALNPREIPSSIENVVYGLVVSDKGEKIFRQVSSDLAHQYAFCMVRDKQAAKQIISDIGVKWSNKDSLVVKVKGQYNQVIQPYQSVDHVTDFIDQVFNSKTLTEMTELNFQELLSSPLPLFVQYVDEKETRADEDLRKIIYEISAAYKDKANFVWMNTKQNSPGYYSLHLYSNGKPPSSPLAFISKQKTVSLQSFQHSLTEAEVKQWIEKCLSDQAPVSYRFASDSWSPRLPTYDYLTMMSIDKLIADQPPFQVKTALMNDPLNTAESLSTSSSPSKPAHSEL